MIEQIKPNDWTPVIGGGIIPKEGITDKNPKGIESLGIGMIGVAQCDPKQVTNTSVPSGWEWELPK